MWVFDPETLRFLDVNRAAVHRYGYAREEFLAMGVRDIRPPEDLPHLDAALSARQRGIVNRGAFRHRTRDGAALDVEITSQEIPWEGRSAHSVVVFEVTERARAEERTRFLADLGRAMQPITDPAEATATAARMLSEHLGADRCAYAEVEPDEDHFTITGDYTRGDTTHIAGRFAMSAFGAEVLRLMRADRAYVVDDIEADPRVTPADLASYEQTQIRAVVCVPLHKAGRFVAAMAVHQTTPRRWLPEEVELVRVVTSRCWESMERARAVRTLVESERRLHLAQEAGRVGVFDWLIPENRVIWAPELEGLYGVPAGSFEGTFDDWRKRVVPEDAQRVEAGLQDCLGRGKTDFDYEFRAVRPDGSVRWLAVQARFVYDEDGRPLRMIGVNVDIHERKRAETEREEALRGEREARHRLEEQAVALEAQAEELQSQATLLEQAQAELATANDELQRANAELAERTAAAEHARAEAEAANRAKSDFLATMSHEIRTPINAIVGYTDLLEIEVAGPLTERQRVHLERIRASSTHLAGLVDDVLDLAKVESGRADVAHERALAVNAIAAALALVRPQAAGKEIAIEDPCGEDEGTFYVGDEDRVRQVLANLLSNAVKFTEPGGRITLTCGTTQEVPPQVHAAEEGPLSYVRVRDTGIGIAPEDLDRVFRPFTQAEQGLTRPRGGTGLGLTISRQLARLMGGDLTVESEPGGGSAFTLWLPSEAALIPPTAEAVLEEVREQRPRGLAEAGEALREGIDSLMERFVRRLVEDPLVPVAAGLARADLEDHNPVFLADVAQALVALGDSDTDVAALVRDGTEIQRVISELHGAQRARLGWSEDALRREFQVLREEVDAAVRRNAPSGTEVDDALRLLARFLGYAERTSLRALRLASVGGAT